MSRKLLPAMEVERTPGGSLRVQDGGERRVLLEHTPEGRNLKICRRPATPDVVTPSCSRPKQARRSLRLPDDDAITRALQVSDGSEDEDSDEEIEYSSSLKRLLREDLGDDECEEGIIDDVVEEDPCEVGMIGEVREQVQDEERMESVEGGDVELRAVEVREQVQDEERMESVEGGDLDLRAVELESVNNDFCWTEDFFIFGPARNVFTDTWGATA